MHADNIPLTPQEVADSLKISKSTVYDLIKRQDLPAYRIGKKIRVDSDDVERYKYRMRDEPVFTESTDPNTGHAAPQRDSTPLEAELQSYPHAPTPPTALSVPHFLEGRTAPRPEQAGSFIISGQDVILDILCHHLDRHPKGIRALRSYEGSYNGLYALYCGNVHVATTHIWDGKTDTYNVPFVERMLPGTPAVILRLATRMQGFYVAKGNPKGIRSWEDLRRSDLVMVNREKGSGTRISFDEHLKLLRISGLSLNGYNRECQSHLAVASTVARGGADLGVGNEKACLQVQGIEFIPLQKEHYDMVIKREDLHKPTFTAILAILRSEDFRQEILGLGGYDLTELGRVVGET